MNIDLSAPIWAIEHVAAAFHLSVDTPRQHSCHPTFPTTKVGFARNLWLREEVLAWFGGLPTRPADAEGQRATNTGTVAAAATKPAKRAGATATTTPTTVTASTFGARPPESFRKRVTK